MFLATTAPETQPSSVGAAPARRFRTRRCAGAAPTELGCVSGAAVAINMTLLTELSLAQFLRAFRFLRFNGRFFGVFRFVRSMAGSSGLSDSSGSMASSSGSSDSSGSMADWN